MGTKLQYRVDLLASLPKSTSHSVINTSDSWEYFQNRLVKENIQRPGLDNFQDNMDRLFEQYNRESVRKTMLAHEEIFKEQVRELHRLYKVQKILMDELGTKEPKHHQFVNSNHRGTKDRPDITDMDNQTGFCSPGSGSQNNPSPFCNWNHSGKANSGHNLHQMYSMRAYPSSQERSGSCSGDALRITKGFDLERPAEDDLSTNVSVIEDQTGPCFQGPFKDKMSINGSQDSRFNTDRESKSEVELTLSIGCSTSKTKLRNCHLQPSLELGCSELTHDEIRQLKQSTLIRSNRGEECGDLTNTRDTAPATFNRESLQQPPWLFHALTLNRT